jgi:hypothetical protein
MPDRNPTIPICSVPLMICIGDNPPCQAVGATYGLMWFNPALVYGIAMSNAGPESYSLHLVEDGYQSLLERIVQVVTVALPAG